jgi:hypothetical protein
VLAPKYKLVGLFGLLTGKSLKAKKGNTQDWYAKGLPERL